MPAPNSAERFAKDRSASTITAIFKVAYILTVLTLATFAVAHIMNN